MISLSFPFLSNFTPSHIRSGIEQCNFKTTAAAGNCSSIEVDMNTEKMKAVVGITS